MRRVNLAARAGSCTDASFSAVFRYPSLGPSRPGRTRVLPSFWHARFLSRVRFSSGGAPGVLPFAGLIPHSGGHAAQVRRLNHLATFLPDRAHVPFVPAHPSRLIFVGMIGRRLGTSESKGGRPGMSWLRLLGFNSRLRSDAPTQSAGESILPWALPLAGLTGTYPCIRSGSTPIGSSASGNPRLRQRSGSRASPIRSWVFGVLPDRDMPATRIARGKSHPCLRRMLPARARRPFSVLMGLMPRSTRPASRPAPGKLPV